MDRELMQQALEAMLAFPDDISDEMFEAIRALKERLAQPEMEPCAGRNCGSTNPNLHSAECFEDYEKATGQGAAPVAADERNKLAAWMMAQGYSTGHGDTIEDLLKELEWQIEDRIKNIIRAKPAKPSRLFGLKAGDNFILRRTKEKYTLVKLKWAPGMGAQYICQNLKTGETVRLHHSVLVEPDNIQESSNK